MDDVPRPALPVQDPSGDVDVEGLADAALAERASAGDSAAFDVLVRRHLPACLGVAGRVLRDPHMAEDAVQDAFLQAWRSWPAYDALRSTPRGWLVMLTHRRAVDRVRVEQRGRAGWAAVEELDEFPDAAPGPWAGAWQAHRAQAVREQLLCLPAAQREALVLCYFGGRTQREVAELTGTPLGTVKSRCHTALRTLQGALAALDVVDA